MEDQFKQRLRNFLSAFSPKPASCESQNVLTRSFGKRKPSDAGADSVVNETCSLSPRPHEQPTGYRAWYILKLGKNNESASA
mmetsp:Transcript_31039/g.62596  ORF Transcript_31039/g.62596 Transcript_31039/m.62596 type:complete len:82 (-) Transcript_31039:225-470(-)